MHRLACVADGFLGEDVRAGKLGRENCARAEKRAFHARPCYPVKLTIADLIRAKSICSKTQFSHIINRLLTSLVRSVL
jgi:hypothetical protein